MTAANTGPDATGTRLAMLLAKGLAAAERLEELLSEERKALESEDLAAIEQLALAKKGELLTLEDLERERVNLLKTRAETPDSAAIDAIAREATGNGSLGQAWQDYLAAAGRCQRANQTNGAIIRLRQQQIARVLTALSGDRPATYGPNGPGRPQHSRALAEA